MCFFNQPQPQQQPTPVTTPVFQPSPTPQPVVERPSPSSEAPTNTPSGLPNPAGVGEEGEVTDGTVKQPGETGVKLNERQGSYNNVTARLGRRKRPGLPNSQVQPRAVFAGYGASNTLGSAT